MAVKMPLIVFVGLLCAFLAVIPPTHSIKCYRIFRPNGHLFYYGIEECTGDYNRCGTKAYTTGSGNVFLMWNCTRLDHDCDQEDVCDKIGEDLEKAGDTLIEETCSISCCNVDECNEPDVAKKKRSLVKLHGKKKDSKVGESFKENLLKRIVSHMYTK